MPLLPALCLAAASSAPWWPLRAQPSPATAEDPTELARGLFLQGVELASAERWEEARARFRQALALRASPLLHFNLAMAAQNSGHLAEARRHYRTFLELDDGRSQPRRRRQALAAVTELEVVLPQLQLRVEGGTPVQRYEVDGESLEPSTLGRPLVLDPGRHTVRLFGEGGARAELSLELAETERRRASIPLQRVLPTSADAAVASTADAAPEPAPAAQPPRTASASLVTRLRRAIELRAASSDLLGRRYWERTVVFYAFQGVGHPLGFLGGGLRFDARPWLVFELGAGALHPFGVGLGAAVSARFPWTYRYAVGLSVGVNTNFTYLGSERRPFTPLWLVPGIYHEWRFGPGLTVRLGLGLRILTNATELHNAQLAAHLTPQPFNQWWQLFYDSPELDRSALPVLPTVLFDVGYAL